MRASPAQNANTITVTATSTSAQEAAALANAFARQYIKVRREAGQKTIELAQGVLEKKLATMTRADRASDQGLYLTQRLEELGIIAQLQTGGYDVSEVAKVPTSPASPQPLRNGALALAVGLVLGVGMAFLFEYLDRRIKDEPGLEREFGVPVLASVPLIDVKTLGGEGCGQAAAGGLRRGALRSCWSPYRTLRSNLQYYGVDRPLETILVTSPLPQEGKTVTAINLALALALSGARVILLDADLRRPACHRYLDLDERHGLSSVLAGSDRLNETPAAGARWTTSSRPRPGAPPARPTRACCCRRTSSV